MFILQIYRNKINNNYPPPLPDYLTGIVWCLSLSLLPGLSMFSPAWSCTAFTSKTFCLCAHPTTTLLIPMDCLYSWCPRVFSDVQMKYEWVCSCTRQKTWPGRFRCSRQGCTVSKTILVRMTVNNNYAGCTLGMGGLVTKSQTVV